MLTANYKKLEPRFYEDIVGKEPRPGCGLLDARPAPHTRLRPAQSETPCSPGLN